MTNSWKSEKRDVVKLPLIFPPHIQRPFKTGLSYKYKITLERGNLKPYPSKLLHCVFVIALIFLPKRSKWKAEEVEGMKTFCFRVQVRHNRKPHHNLSWRIEEGTRIIHGTVEQAIVLTEKVWHPIQNSDKISTRTTGQHAFLWRQTLQRSSVSKTRKNVFVCVFLCFLFCF